MGHVILASGSPRRAELMTLLPINFEVKTKEVDEVIDSTLTPGENVCSLAYQKASAVSKDNKEQWVIGCDTVVVFENQILGKPKDESDAKRMLEILSGKTHQVYTGVCLINESKAIKKSFYVSSDVVMKTISSEEIHQYVLSKEPMDKAGSYAIQGKGAVFIEKIQGDYFNIVGLPVSNLYDVLKEFQIISQ